MFDRNALIIAAASAGLLVLIPASRCLGAERDTEPSKPHPAMMATEAGHEDHDKDEHDEKGDSEKHDKKEKHEEKEIEQSVPMNMVPQPVIDAVMKECPGGKITEAELEAKHGKIMYGFDVTAGEMKYDVKITVDGKFYSKKNDDDKDEKDEKEAGAKS